MDELPSSNFMSSVTQSLRIHSHMYTPAPVSKAAEVSWLLQGTGPAHPPLLQPGRVMTQLIGLAATSLSKRECQPVAERNS